MVPWQCPCCAEHPAPVLAHGIITNLHAGNSFNLSHNEGPEQAGGTHPALGFRGSPAHLESTLGWCHCRCEHPQAGQGWWQRRVLGKQR